MLGLGLENRGRTTKNAYRPIYSLCERESMEDIVMRSSLQLESRCHLRRRTKSEYCILYMPNETALFAHPKRWNVDPNNRRFAFAQWLTFTCFSATVKTIDYKYEDRRKRWHVDRQWCHLIGPDYLLFQKTLIITPVIKWNEHFSWETHLKIPILSWCLKLSKSKQGFSLSSFSLVNRYDQSF
jgi:hypothetical protein